MAGGGAASAAGGWRLRKKACLFPHRAEDGDQSYGMAPCRTGGRQEGLMGEPVGEVI